MHVRVAYLHGFLGRPESWSAVRPRGEAVHIALPGHGGGPVLDSWGSNVEAVARALGTCDVVVGYSLGGRVAIALVVAGYVSRAVLVSTNPGLANADRGPRRASDARWACLLRERGLAAFIDAWEAQPLFASQVRVPAHTRQARREHRLAHDPEQLARVLEVMSPAEMPDYRSHIDRRFHHIVGADDAKYIAIARSLPAPVSIIEAAGHDPLFEQPAALAGCLDSSLAGFG